MTEAHYGRLKEYRKQVPVGHLAFLDWVWAEFKKDEKWPSRRECIKHFRSRKNYEKIVTGLDGNLVCESDSYRDRHFELTVLGLLCTSNGALIEIALLRVLDAILNAYLENEDNTELNYLETLDGDGSLAEEIYFSMRAYHNLVPTSSYHAPPSFTLTVSDPAEVLTDFELSYKYLEKRAFQNFFSEKQPLVEDRRSNEQAFCTLQLSELSQLIHMAAAKVAMDEQRVTHIEKSVKLIIYILCAIVTITIVLQYYPGINFFTINTDWMKGVGKILGIAGAIWGVTILWVIKKLPTLITKQLDRAYCRSLSKSIDTKNRVLRKKVIDSLLHIE